MLLCMVGAIRNSKIRKEKSWRHYDPMHILRSPQKKSVFFELNALIKFHSSSSYELINHYSTKIRENT